MTKIVGFALLAFDYFFILLVGCHFQEKHLYVALLIITSVKCLGYIASQNFCPILHLLLSILYYFWNR